jgi:hypothetical protein
MFEKTGDRWEDKFEGLPGFGLVVAIMVALLAWWSPNSGEAVGRETNALVGVAVAYLLYRSGTLLDKPLFNRLYGGLREAPRWPGGHRLHKARLKAAENLNCPLTGLYAKAEGIVKLSEDWHNEVKSKMDASKAARSFILPLFWILLVQLTRRRVPHPDLGPFERILEGILVAAVLLYLLVDKRFLQTICLVAAPILLMLLFLDLPEELLNSWQFHPLTLGGAFVLAIGLYTWQRLGAMTKLYDLAGDLTLLRHSIKLENVSTGKPETRAVLFAGKTVLPLRKVALYPCKEQDVTEAELQDAEKLVRSLAAVDVQVNTQLERPAHAVGHGREGTLPVYLLSKDRMNRIIGYYKPQDSQAVREAQPDLVIQVVRTAEMPPNLKNLRKELERNLANLINRKAPE